MQLEQKLAGLRSRVKDLQQVEEQAKKALAGVTGSAGKVAQR